MPTIPILLTIAFFILKTCGQIHWSWWWIFSPLIIAFVFGCVKNGVKETVTRWMDFLE